MFTEEQARTIVNEARSQGVTVEVADTPEAMISMADHLVVSAREAFAKGVRGDHVTAIINMAESFGGGPGGDPMGSLGPADEEPEGTREEPRAPDPEATPTRAAAEQRVHAERLPVPAELEGDPPEMPRDLTAIGDREVRKLHSEFNAYLARVQYLIGIEKSDQEGAERLADFHEGRALAGMAGATDGQGKALTQHVLLAKARQDPDAKQWRDKAVQHKANLNMLYQLRDIYAGNIERLQRDWRMRTDEFNMQGGSR